MDTAKKPVPQKVKVGGLDCIKVICPGCSMEKHFAGPTEQWCNCGHRLIVEAPPDWVHDEPAKE